MEEMVSMTRKYRVAAWKKAVNEKLGRDYVSSVKGYVVAGCVLDILDDIWDRKDLNSITQIEELLKNQYNVYVYGLLRYPPVSRDLKKTIE